MTDATQTAVLPQVAPSVPGGRALLRNVVINVVVPLIVVLLMQNRLGFGVVPSFAVAALFPAGHTVADWVRRRRVDPIGSVMLIVLTVNIALSMLTHDVRFTLLKGAPAFAVFGLACLASVLFAQRPVMFFVGRYFAANGDAGKNAAWTARLQQDGFRSSMRRLTLIWGAACTLEASLCIAAAFMLPPTIAVIAEPILTFATIAGLLAWTTAYARRRAARAG